MARRSGQASLHGQVCNVLGHNSRLARSSLIWYAHTLVRGTRWLSSNRCVEECDTKLNVGA